MSSLIANQVKTNNCSHLTDTTIIITITACPIHLFAILLTTATVLLLFLEHHMQLVTRLLELQLTHLTLLYTQNSLQDILKVEGSRSRLLETSIATACICAFSHLSVPHACCCCSLGVCCIC